MCCGRSHGSACSRCRGDHPMPRSRTPQPSAGMDLPQPWTVIRLQPLRIGRFRHLTRGQCARAHDRLRFRRVEFEAVALEETCTAHEPRPLGAIEKRAARHDASGCASRTKQENPCVYIPVRWRHSLRMQHQPHRQPGSLWRAKPTPVMAGESTHTR